MLNSIKKIIIAAIVVLSGIVMFNPAPIHAEIKRPSATTVDNPSVAPNTLIVSYSDHNGNAQIGRSFPENTKIKHVKAVILSHKTIVKLQNGSQIILGDNANIVVGKNVKLQLD